MPGRPQTLGSRIDSRLDRDRACTERRRRSAATSPVAVSAASLAGTACESGDRRVGRPGMDQGRPAHPPPGMTLRTPDAGRRTPDAGTATVERTRSYEKRQRTYDLTVEEVHTHYVLAGTTPIPVHNADSFDWEKEQGRG
ncbi:hypothetical protein ACWGBV_03445 [Streptomyces sp. NPDC055051]